MFLLFQLGIDKTIIKQLYCFDTFCENRFSPIYAYNLAK